MHGRPRPVPGAAVDPDKAKAAKQRLALLTRLNDEVLARRAAGRADPASLGLAASLLEHNPEAYTAWNHRREVLGPVLAGGGAAAVAAAEAELALTEKALRRNPKSYAAWHARRWVVGHRLSSLDAELRVVDALLDADGRNFHAWAYRAWVADLAGVPAAVQLEATTRRIEANFSNYSAWHARSALLVRVHGGGGGGGGLPPPVLDSEYALVRSAAFTDPTDQAPWFYHRWLVANTVAAARGGGGGGEGGGNDGQVAAAVEAADATLAAEVAACEALLDAEPDRSVCKWPILALAHLAEARAGLRAGLGREGGGGGGGEGAAPSPRAPPPSAAALYEELAVLDPLRAGFYADAAAGRAAVVVPEL